MKEDCGCDEVGALTFADERDDYDELDLVLDDPEVGAVLMSRDEWADDSLGALSLVGDEGVEGWDEGAIGALVEGEIDYAALMALDDEELGWIATAIAAGKAAYDVGKGIYKSATKPSRKKARRAQQRARVAQDDAKDARAELRKMKKREAKNKERNRKIREINQQRRVTQAHRREKQALEQQIADLKKQQALVRRERRTRERELAAKEKEGQSTRRLMIGGGVTAAGLLAAYALTRRKPDEVEAKR